MSHVTAQVLSDIPPVLAEGDLFSGLAGESDGLSHKPEALSRRSGGLSHKFMGLSHMSGRLSREPEGLPRESGGLSTQPGALSMEFAALIYAIRSLIDTVRGHIRRVSVVRTAGILGPEDQVHGVKESGCRSGETDPCSTLCVQTCMATGGIINVGCDDRKVPVLDRSQYPRQQLFTANSKEAV